MTVEQRRKKVARYIEALQGVVSALRLKLSESSPAIGFVQLAAQFAGRGGAAAVREVLQCPLSDLFGPEIHGSGDGASPDGTPQRTVMVDYTNWRGERGARRIVPDYMWWGSTEYHPKPQWLLRALDVEKRALRDFAMGSIHSWTTAPAAPDADEPQGS